MRLEYPPISSQLSGLKSTLATWARAGFPIADAATLERRRYICLHCRFWSGARCLQCGCTRLKWFLKTATCPLTLWTIFALTIPPYLCVISFDK
jgi:hypothetical protein